MVDQDHIRHLAIFMRPFTPPTSPDRFLEWLLLALGIMFLGADMALVYEVFRLDLPQALWAVAPLLLLPLGFVWGWRYAKRKRLAAEQQVERYRHSLRRAMEDC